MAFWVSKQYQGRPRLHARHLPHTARQFRTVNGVEARGGALNGPGPTIVDGMVYVLSGYGSFGFMRGNVLLVFAIED